MGSLFLQKPAISLKRGNIGPRLLLITNRKSHTQISLQISLVTLVLSRTVSEIRRVIGWKLRMFPTPLSFNALALGEPFSNFWMKLTEQKLEGWGYCTVKITWSYLQPFLHESPVWQTDGRTDRQTDGIAIAYARLARCRAQKLPTVNVNGQPSLCHMHLWFAGDTWCHINVCWLIDWLINCLFVSVCTVVVVGSMAWLC